MNAGVRFALKSHESAEESAQNSLIPLHDDEEVTHGKPLFVNPHEDTELNYRIGTETQLWGSRLRPAVEVSRIQVLSSGAEVNTFVTIGTRWSAQISPSLALLATGELPIANQSRYDWRVGLGLQAGL